MLTVKEFKDLGVGFVTGDSLNPELQECVIIGCCIGVMDVSGDLNQDHEVASFAWRPLNTLPENPKFKYELGNQMLLWRPLLDQSSPSKPYDFDEHVSEAKPVLTQAMAYMQHELWLHKANSELLATLTEFMVKNNIGNAGESCIDVAIRELSEKHGIDSRTPEQKAVDELRIEILDFYGYGDDDGYKSLSEHLNELGYERNARPAA